MLLVGHGAGTVAAVRDFREAFPRSSAALLRVGAYVSARDLARPSTRRSACVSWKTDEALFSCLAGLHDDLSRVRLRSEPGSTLRRDRGHRTRSPALAACGRGALCRLEPPPGIRSARPSLRGTAAPSRSPPPRMYAGSCSSPRTPHGRRCEPSKASASAAACKGLCAIEGGAASQACILSCASSIAAARSKRASVLPFSRSSQPSGTFCQAQIGVGGPPFRRSLLRPTRRLLERLSVGLRAL